MHELRRDPINKAIYGKHGLMTAIDVLFEKECLFPGITMILGGIDIMSNLDRPESQTENTPEDFKNWVRKYIRIPGDSFLTPDNIWATRNAMLHTYGLFSRDVRSGRARMVIWLPNPHIAVYHSPEMDPQQIRVDPFAFRDAFRSGVQDFLCRMLSSDKKHLLDERVNQLITYLPFKFDI